MRQAHRRGWHRRRRTRRYSATVTVLHEAAMEPVFRSIAVSLIVLVGVRISRRRARSQLTTFDSIRPLIIGEATQQALLGNDFSIINPFVVIATLTTLEVAFSRMGRSAPAFGRVMEGLPVVLVEHGKLLRERA